MFVLNVKQKNEYFFANGTTLLTKQHFSPIFSVKNLQAQCSAGPIYLKTPGKIYYKVFSLSGTLYRSIEHSASMEHVWPIGRVSQRKYQIIMASTKVMKWLYEQILHNIEIVFMNGNEW